MSINHKNVKVNTPKIYAAIFIVVSVLIVNLFHLHSIQMDKRKQARDNLEHTVGCLDYLDGDGLSFDDMKTCANWMRTSKTGDMYIVDRDTMYFAYDGSDDVPQNLYFTEESVGKYFTEWSTAEKFIPHIKSDFDSKPNTLISYNFDGATEYLEYKKYTTEGGRRLVVVQGIQSDEITHQYRKTKLLVSILTIIYVSWLVSSAIGGRRDDISGSNDSASK